MTTTARLWGTSKLARLRANWPALLLPLIFAQAFGFPYELAWIIVVAAAAFAVLAPVGCANAAPFLLIALGILGFFEMHSLPIQWGKESQPVLYSLVGGYLYRGTWLAWHTSGPAGLVLAEALAYMSAGVWLLTRPNSPGGTAVRRAVAQLRGTGGQPRTVPPLLLILVIFLWEELFAQRLWFGQLGWLGFTWGSRLLAALIIALGLAVVRWVPRAAAVLAVTGIVFLALFGMAWPFILLRIDTVRAVETGRVLVLFFGAVPLDNGAGLFALAQGIALLVAGLSLTPRLLTWRADFELAERARVLARRVDRLTTTRGDATDTAVAELRRIERDLHDGAQARMVAVGMSLRTAEKVLLADPEAALALVAEAREASSRAITELRDLVRGVYPPVLADRGLAEAVRNLALDAVMDVGVDVDLPGEPPMPVAAAVYFAVAEALTNAVRHAYARSVQISVRYAGGKLRASVIDDGWGGADATRGTGLAGMERRLAPFDGILAVSSPAGGPTIVAIEVPCALSATTISSTRGTA